MDQNSTRKLIEGQLIRLEGIAFQECMDRMGLELYPGDYQPVRAAGPKGDTKNDGYCPKARVFFAAHATRGETIAKTKAKIRNDLTGCLEQHRDVATWRFLTNDTLPGEVDQFIDNELRTLNPNVTLETWGLKTLSNEICRLSQVQIEKIIDINFTVEPKPIRVAPDPEVPSVVMLDRVKTGRNFWPILSQAHSFGFDEPEDCTDSESDFIITALEVFKEWGEASDILGDSLARVRDAQRSIGGMLEELETKGFIVFAGTKRSLITGGVMPPAPWLTAMIKVVRSPTERPDSSGK
ncbi:hypothetical protein [Streptomyces uncialis]|uniref:hypothetical protein n=1 Tax=Streptomyces uncialis TaxID=1048205 RepID=UPI0033E48F9C